MTVLVEDHVGRKCERRDRPHKSGSNCKFNVFIHMENLHDRDAARLRTVDQGLLLFDVGQEFVVTEIGPMAKRFLRVDDEKRCLVRHGE
ncbi:hypothetical protein D3C73_1233100 [compost metagenome]